MYRRVLGDALGLSEEVLRREGMKPTAQVARVYLAAARELAEGIISELDACPPRPTNAIRLGRHLWEIELELAYLLDQPNIRMGQIAAADASRRLLAERLNPGLRLRTPKRKWFTEIVEAEKKAAVERLTTADLTDGERTGKRKHPPELDWKVPDREEIARILERRQPGREADYHLIYRASSQLSHPGPFSMDTYLIETAPERIDLRLDRSDPIREAQALVLAVKSFLPILDAANWQLGATIGADLRRLMADAKAA